MKTSSLKRGGVAITLACSLLLSACGSSDGGDGTDAAACKPATEGQKVTLSFSSWIPNFQKVVDLWNSKHPDIQVKYTEVTAGTSGTYQNYLNQVKAGNTDDLGFIEYDALPTFRVQNGLRNFYDCAGVADVKDKFIDAVWNQTSLGQDDTTYGLGLDYGPESLFYRKDLFDKAGIKVPTTWEEFYEAAKAIRAKGGYIANFPSTATYWAALFMQAGDDWFKFDGDSWRVDIASEKSKQTADFLQKLIDEHLVTTYPLFQDEYSRAFNSGQVWTQLGGPWATALMKASAGDTSGKWRVAKAPTWEPDGIVGTWGGACMAMFKDTKHPYEAAQFAIWASTDPEALALNSAGGGVYPPIKDVVSNTPSMQAGLDFYGGQPVFKDIDGWAADVSSSWVWGPTMVQTNADLDAEMAKALAGKQTVFDALQAVQAKTAETLKDQGISVSE